MNFSCRFYEDLQDLLELTRKKRCSFHYKGLECKSRKSRDIWSNRQIWPWSTKWSRAKTNRVLPRERTGHSKHPLPTTQEKTWHTHIIRWSTSKSDWLYSLQPNMGRGSTLAWKIPWMEKPGRLQSMESRKVGHNWETSFSLLTFMHWRRNWQPTPAVLRGESQGRESLVGCRLWGHTESDTTEAT